MSTRNKDVIGAFLDGRRGRNSQGTLVSEATLTQTVLRSKGEPIAVISGGRSMVRVTDADDLSILQRSHLALLLQMVVEESRSTWPEEASHLRGLAARSGFALRDEGRVRVDTAITALVLLVLLLAFWAAAGYGIYEAVRR